MKIITQGDPHIRSTIPFMRSDNYYETQFKKVRQLIAWGSEFRAPVLIPGDLLDSNQISYRAYHRLQTEFMKSDQEIIVIRGNHDSYYHSNDIDGTPLGSMADAGAFTLLEGSMRISSGAGPEITVHGCGFGAEPPSPEPGAMNILLIHTPVFCDEVPFFMKDGVLAPDLEKKYPGFDLYLAGDIHEPCLSGKTVVTGSMMRMNVEQRDYEPRAYLIDLETMEKKPLFYDIEPDVFLSGEAESCGEYSSELESLIKELESDTKAKIDYRELCLGLCSDIKVKSSVEELFGRVQNL